MPDKEKGPSASAWLSLRTELVGTLQKAVSLAALAFLDSRRGDQSGSERPMRAVDWSVLLLSVSLFLMVRANCFLLGNPVYINFR